MVRIVTLGLLALVLSGCGSWADPREWFSDTDPAAEPAELQDVSNRIKPTVTWSRDTGSGNRHFVRLKPGFAGGIAYTLDPEGELQALDLANGSVLWEKETGLPASAGPGVGEGALYVGTSEADVVALDMESGEPLWQQRLSSEVLAVPVADQGIVVVHTADGNLFGLDSATGEQRWRYDRKVPVLTLRGTGSPVISGSTVIAGLAGGKLVALALDTGQLEWERKITVPGGRSDLERVTDIDGDPLVYNGAIFVGSYQGEVAAVGEGSGQVFWNRKLSNYNDMAVNWQQLAVSDAQGHVWSLDPDTGSAKWRQQALQNRRLSAPVIIGDYVVVGDYQGYLHWLSTVDGAIVARTRAGSDPIVAAPVVIDGVLYVLSSGGDLFAIKLPEAS